MSEIKTIIAKRSYLIKNLLLVEGISRSGKFLLANILNGFTGVEPAQYCELLEQIPYLAKFKLVNSKVAEALLHAIIDSNSYNMLLGRNFNYRLTDKSSILNNMHYQEYLKRSAIKDSQRLLKKFYQQNFYSPYIVHEIMPAVKIFFKTFPNVKVLSLRRSPLDLVYSHYMWYASQTKLKKYSPPLFILLKQGHDSIPWQRAIYQNSENDKQLINNMIIGMEKLLADYTFCYRSLSRQDKNKILFVSYEDILADPKAVMRQISDFLQRKILSAAHKILVKEKLPNTDYHFLQTKKITIIKALASPKYFQRLWALEERHQAQIY